MYPERNAQRWLGIDFSGDHLMWTPRRKGNIYVAEMRVLDEVPVLSMLLRVQDLPGSEPPFQRLVRLLGERKFVAAGIDAPFCVPDEFLPDHGYRALLEKVAGIWRGDRPFPAAREFVELVLAGRNPSRKKPLRETELAWAKRRVNVRSTLWAKARGGAAMTAACLTLLHESGCPIWPWDGDKEPGLLIEAFPAAQLCHWGMDFVKYNGKSNEASNRRRAIVDQVAGLIEIPYRSIREKMLSSADALDAVLCAFAAIAVSRKCLWRQLVTSQEGEIAVHDRLESRNGIGNEEYMVRPTRFELVT